jgi:hypothetical protein
MCHFLFGREVCPHGHSPEIPETLNTVRIFQQEQVKSLTMNKDFIKNFNFNMHIKI